MRIRKASRSMTYAKILLTGPSGSGKSMSALLLARGMSNKMPDLGGNSKRIGYIGSEGDRDELYADQFDYDIISLEENEKNPEGYTKALNEFLNAGYKIIIIDSLTHLWNWVNDRVQEEEETGRRGNTFNYWGKWKKPNKAFQDRVLNAEAHIICTVRGKDQYEIDKDANGKTRITKLGVGSQQDKDTEYEFMLSLLIDQKTHMASATKDNTKIFDKGYNNSVMKVLTEKDGEAIMDWAINGMGDDLAECRDLRTKITELGNSKGGQQNVPFMRKYTELFPNGFKNVNNAAELKKALEILSEIPDYNAWIDECNGLRAKITQIATEKGGKSNAQFMEKFNEIFKGAFNTLNDVDVLKDAITTLSQIPKIEPKKKESAPTDSKALEMNQMAKPTDASTEPQKEDVKPSEKADAKIDQEQPKSEPKDSEKATENNNGNKEESKK